MWTIDMHVAVRKRYSDFVKKWEPEVLTVMANLDEFKVALDNGVNPEQLKQLRYVRNESEGILAIDQTGTPKRAKPVPFRLYVYPDESAKVLHVFTLGNKATQSADLAEVKQFVRGLLSGKKLTAAKVQQADSGSHLKSVKDDTKEGK